MRWFLSNLLSEWVAYTAAHLPYLHVMETAGSSPGRYGTTLPPVDVWNAMNRANTWPMKACTYSILYKQNTWPRIGIFFIIIGQPTRQMVSRVESCIRHIRLPYLPHVYSYTDESRSPPGLQQLLPVYLASGEDLCASNIISESVLILYTRGSECTLHMHSFSVMKNKLFSLRINFHVAVRMQQPMNDDELWKRLRTDRAITYLTSVALLGADSWKNDAPPVINSISPSSTDATSAMD